MRTGDYPWVVALRRGARDLWTRVVTTTVMFIVSGLDPGAAVSELRGFPGTRLVYGVLPGRVIDRMLTRPAKVPSRSRPVER